ncbi:NADH-quinone oxidoreductase subunit H [Geobacter sulfurreducens]|jgi:formate hydrogenlyase subunit 4|uniref:Ech-hydrogenase-related complex, NuoH-like integral membrane subunit n=1 Tax=Geobacter sulfurreducens (strain ATCC 51573 / DSM 12127 / PCA) TaxID=243231 RepID=Q74F69_GEOSL|nr:NADH-quinone oxidoreductase subunit H [Geobacter sulfurreducens]AAR34070.1 Ech-hydrogenase-related complex, NuoH-like integral membrane subunit [Geobacter sulfurreducens PCA]UAC04799.1 NADH-quinone oxidoreductase subunit H [Geobacter sulfurreducens]UTG93430.1 NADH-quinone oxidoreductase subunit H [Geobacter sulfurreducens]HCD96501.1 hydrogenase [Geobacter sulfurreducens]
MLDIIIHLLLAILMPPLLLGVIVKTKAAFAGRVGAPLLQPYYDIARLLRKGSVFSDTTTWVFRAGPVVTLAATAVAALLVPLGNHPAPVSFAGDMILFAYLFGLARFFTTVAALDTGSSFEGMGAAREVTFSCLAEPTLFFALITLARMSGSLSLTPMLTHATVGDWLTAGASLLLLVGALFLVLLVENCRIPFDDPTTHLELTMIHEVMVLDHSGPAFGLILYGAALKLFVLGAFFMNVALPVRTGNTLADWGIFVASMLVLAVAVGVVESVMARLRLIRIPQLLVAATILSAFSMLLILR